MAWAAQYIEGHELLNQFPQLDADWRGWAVFWGDTAICVVSNAIDDKVQEEFVKDVCDTMNAEYSELSRLRRGNSLMRRYILLCHKEKTSMETGIAFMALPADLLAEIRGESDG